MELFHVKKFRFLKKNENILTTKKSGFYGGRFRAFLSYFPVTYHLFPSYFSNISHFSVISYLFPSYFLKISHFPIISGLFLSHFSLLNYTSQLLLDYFSSTSQLFLSYFSTISRLLLVV